MPMQQLVIDRLLRKNLFVVEEMHFLPIGQCDLRMFPQEIMKRSRSRLLRTRHNEIEALNFVSLPEHRRSFYQLGRSCRASRRGYADECTNFSPFSRSWPSHYS